MKRNYHHRPKPKRYDTNGDNIVSASLIFFAGIMLYFLTEAIKQMSHF